MITDIRLIPKGYFCARPAFTRTWYGTDEYFTVVEEEEEREDVSRFSSQGSQEASEFNEFDTDKDNVLSSEEIEAMFQAQ